MPLDKYERKREESDALCENGASHQILLHQITLPRYPIFVHDKDKQTQID